MKIPHKRRQRRRAFTFVEMLISIAIVALAAGGIYLALTACLNLYAKNTSVNTAHQQMLSAVQWITRDLHAAADTPELLTLDVNGIPIPYTGTGPAAGVALEVLWQRPFLMRDRTMMDAVPNGTSIVTIDTGSPPGPRPTAGQRIILPYQFAIEEIITLVAPHPTTPSYTNVTMQNPAWRAIPFYASMPRTAVITDRIAYVVINGDLHFYTGQYSGGILSWLDRGVRARGVTTPTPFSLTDWTYPNTGLRTSATGFNAADLFGIAYQSDTQTYWKLTATTPAWLQVDATSGSRAIIGRFTIRDSTYSNRAYDPTANPLGYKATNMPVTFKVPYRAKIRVF